MLDKNPAPRLGPRAPITVLPQYWSDEASRRRYLDGLFDGTAGDYDFVERLLGFGTGLVAREALTLVAPGGRVVGLDPSAGMLEQAHQLDMARVRGLGERLPFRDESFDFISMGFALRHVADLEGLFGEMRRVLRPGGTACVLELTRPASPLVAAPLRFFMTRVVPGVARLSRRHEHAHRLMQFFWDTIDACVPPEAVLAALGRAGFAAPRRSVALGMFSDYVAVR